MMHKQSKCNTKPSLGQYTQTPTITSQGKRTTHETNEE